MVCTKNRKVFYTAVTLLALAVVGGLCYYIWYETYYKYNNDRVHTLKFSQSNYKVEITWQRKDHESKAEIYDGKHWQHVIDLGRWFTSSKDGDVVSLVSGYGPSMEISIHDDSTDFASIRFWSGSCSTYFRLNNLQWYSESRVLVDPNLSVVTTDMKSNYATDKQFECRS